jgi:ribonuclease H-related protein
MSKFYAVKAGHKLGIYLSWPECQAQVKGFSGAIFKSFTAKEEAEKFIIPEEEEKIDHIFYTDGSYMGKKCGGAAVDTKNMRVYYSSIDGEDQTNNRGELTGIILALSNSDGPIKICTDSQISINILANGYTARANLDLIDIIQKLMAGRKVIFKYVAAHCGIYFNELADTYAKKATLVDRMHVESI